MVVYLAAAPSTRANESSVMPATDLLAQDTSFPAGWEGREREGEGGREREEWRWGGGGGERRRSHVVIGKDCLMLALRQLLVHVFHSVWLLP